MRHFLLSTVLSMASICLVFPLIGGLSYTGGIFVALALALLTTATALFAKAVGRALTLTLRVKTFGHAAIVLTPVWLIGAWLLPAAELEFFSGMFPGTLSFASWSSALAAASILLAIIALTNRWSETLKKPCDCG